MYVLKRLAVFVEIGSGRRPNKRLPWIDGRICNLDLARDCQNCCCASIMRSMVWTRRSKSIFRIIRIDGSQSHRMSRIVIKEVRFVRVWHIRASIGAWLGRLDFEFSKHLGGNTYAILIASRPQVQVMGLGVMLKGCVDEATQSKGCFRGHTRVTLLGIAVEFVKNCNGGSCNSIFGGCSSLINSW